MPPFRSISLLCLLCWLLCTWMSASADINHALRSDDKRLNVPVTVLEERLHIAELLSRLSAQTGVNLKINPRLEASGITLMASLIDLPLADAMNALTALVGCRSARWYWERQGKPGSFTYWLQAPHLSDIAVRLRAKAQHDFERQATVLMKAAAMSPEERKELLGQNKADDPGIKDLRVMSGISIFAESVSSDLQQRLLRGETTLKIPVSQLSSEGQAFVRSEYRISGILDRDPDSVSFSTNQFNGVTPTLFMEIGDIGGSGYVGGVPLNNQFTEELANEWLLPGDTSSNPLDTAVVSRPKNYQPPSLQEVDLQNFENFSIKEQNEYFLRFKNITQKRLAQLSQAAPIAVMAIVPEAQSDIGEPYKQTIGHFASLLHQLPYAVLSKWHGKVLLLNYGRWFLSMDTFVPFATIEQLSAKERKGLFALNDLAATADRLSNKQLISLSGDFPIFKSVADAQGVFVLHHRFPEVQATGGIIVTSEIVRILNQFGSVQVSKLPEGTRVRIHETVKETLPLPGSQILFELIGPNGRPLSGLVIQQGTLFPLQK